MEYVHADLWGPAQIATHEGKVYFLSLVDDYSKKVWTYMLKYKSKTLDKFKVWKLLVENQTNKTLKVLRLDNGLEFYNKEFDRFCKKNGVLRPKIVSYMPQQSGVVKRMNMTLLNKVRSVLVDAGLTKQFWGEALATTTYLVNRSPSSAVEFKCPEEVWTWKIPCLRNLRNFGCVGNAHNKEGKLDPRSTKCIFLGYAEGVKGYRLWYLEPKGTKLIISRDVIFNENVFPYLSTATNHAGSNKDTIVDKQQEDVTQTNRFVIDTNSQVEQITDNDPTQPQETQQEEEQSDDQLS